MKISTLKIFGTLMLIIVLATLISACVQLPPSTSLPLSTDVSKCIDVSREARQLQSDEPFVHLYAPKVNVTADEQFSLHLGAVNPTGTAGNMTITLILTVPSGISITGSDFGTGIQGFTHNTVTLTKGESREIGIPMIASTPPKDQLTENSRITGQIFWEVEGSDQSFNDCYKVDLTVSHEPVELTFDLSDLPDDADVRVASPGMCSESEDNSCSLPYGDTQDLDINLNDLNEEYRFLRYEYTGDKPEDVGSKSTTIRLTEDTTIKPIVERVRVYTLVLRAGPERAGRASVQSRDCTPSCGIRDNQTFTISAVSERGWIFTGWESSNISIPDPNAEQVRGLTLSGNTTITARFARELTLTIGVKRGGRVEVEGSDCSGGCPYSEDTRLEIRANPDPGWNFVRWEPSGSVPNSTTSARTNITLTEDTDVTAIFGRAKVTLRIIVDSGGEIDRYTFGDDCDGTCSREFDYGSSVRIDADEDSGWDFDRWEVVSGSTPNGFNSRDEDHTITLNGDVTLRLRFERDPSSASSSSSNP